MGTRRACGERLVTDEALSVGGGVAAKAAQTAGKILGTIGGFQLGTVASRAASSLQGTAATAIGRSYGTKLGTRWRTGSSGGRAGASG